MTIELIAYYAIFTRYKIKFYFSKNQARQAAMKVKDLIKLIENDGWSLVRTKGSHRQFHHPTKSGTVTVSGKPNIEVPPGTLNSVLRQSGLKK